MIVVVGNPGWQEGESARPAGTVAGIATAAAGEGADVELVGRIGDDEAGDALLLALARAHVGHAAVLRDPSRPTLVTSRPPPDADEDLLGAPDTPAQDAGANVAPPDLAAADLELGLRYLTDFAVVVVAEPLSEDALRVVNEAAAFAEAQLVVVVPAGADAGELPAKATVLQAPPADPDGSFAAFVGRYAAALDRSVSPADAFRQTVERAQAEPVAEV